MQKAINITYTYGDQLNQTADYQYDMQLSDSENFKVDYFTGKQRDTQMDALAIALKDALPDSAIVKEINHVSFTATKASILDMLKRKDDYLATVLFDANETETKAETASPQPEAKADTKDTKETADTEADKTASPRLIEYQPANTHTYQELDLNEQEPAKTEKVRKIGISRLSYAFNYGDLKRVLNTKKVDIFKTPLGVVPSNGKVTETRRHTFSTNAGLVENALQDAKEILLGTVKNTNNDKEYSMYAFETQAAKAAKDADAAKEADAAPVAKEANADKKSDVANETQEAQAPETTSATAPVATEAVKDTQASAVPEQAADSKQAAPVSETTKEANSTGVATAVNDTQNADAAINPFMQAAQAAKAQSVDPDKPNLNPFQQNAAPAANPLTDNEPTADLFHHYTDDPFKMKGQTAAAPVTPTTPIAPVADESLAVPKAESKQEMLKDDTATLDAISEQLSSIQDKLDTLVMNSNNATSPAQANNDLSVLLNELKLKLNELTTQSSAPADNEIVEIKQKLDKVLANQANDKPREPNTLNELILQESNLTDADMNLIPDRIKNFCFKHNEAMPMERANFLFEMMNYLKDTMNIPEDLKCLSDPEVFLKAVHLLSWFN